MEQTTNPDTRLADTMLLFLDFDGVLHPQYSGTSTPEDIVFCHLPSFENIMRDFPDVEIVLSTTWRHQFSVENLRSRFSHDIQPRIVGVTPLVQCEEGQYVHGQREQEILQWLLEANRSDEDWVALDDTNWQFPIHRDKVIACVSYIGFDDSAAESLRKRLISSL